MMSYQNEYNRRTYKGYTLRLRLDTEADLIRYLESRGDSPQNVIKDMLKRSMKASQRRNADNEVK